ncbi:MAG: 4Fe-4S binding protein [Tannerellaceae bacterium]|nr:4Fe-4S binding protein [Tannerellaceae bacterium]
MLRKIRMATAAFCGVLITLLFLDFTGTIHGWFGWLAKIQFVPAILALNVGVIVFLVLLTLLLGRIYWSVICPLGVYQDMVSRLAARRKKRRFSYSPPVSWLRYGVLVLFVVAMVAGISVIVSVLDPYATYGRMSSNLLAPFYRWGNNFLAYLAERTDSYLFYDVAVWLPGIATFIVAILLFVVVTLLAWRGGRTYCNTICPVGTVLGMLSRFSFYKPVFVADQCNQCGLCARNCKASCMDSKNQTIDYSRCVTCMNCIETCNKAAMKYLPGQTVQKKTEVPAEIPVKPIVATADSRRRFLSVTSLFALTTVAAKAQTIEGDGGLAPIEDKKRLEKETPIVPPGAMSLQNMNTHCTACQLCVSVCPNQILYPSGKLHNFMQPEIAYERGYCRPECTQCSEVCPTGAIRSITTADKSAIQIGHAIWNKERCLVDQEDVKCRVCESHCPTNAIQLVPRDPADPDSLRIPAIDNERCIGCGACEHLCPSRPYSAIYVEGNHRHRIV